MSNEEKSGLKHWVPAFVLMVCVVLAFFDKISIAVLFSDPHFQSSMGIAEDKAKLGWLMTSFLLAYGFSSVFLSFLGDIFNPKKMLFWSVTSWGLLMLCMGFTTSYSGMLILRVLLGLAEGPLFALAYTIVKQTYTDRQQARASTMFLLGTPIGAFLGFPITAAVLAHHDWHTTFFVMAALTLIAILSIVFGLRNLQLLVGQPTQQGIPLQLHQIVINGYTVLTLISGLLSKISSIKKTTQSAWFFYLISENF
ncbi:hypothetical protein GCM10010203_26860 [Actinomadura yumaensis]